MSFRVRLTLLCVLAVAVTVVLASVVSYLAVSNRLHDQTDDSVRADAIRLARLPVPVIALPYFGLPTPNKRDYLRVTSADGRSQHCIVSSPGAAPCGPVCRPIRAGGRIVARRRK